MTLKHIFKKLSKSMKNIFKVLTELLERKTIVSKKNAQDGNNRRLYIIKGKISSLKLNSEKNNLQMENQYIMGPIKQFNIYAFGTSKEEKGRKIKNKP